ESVRHAVIRHRSSGRWHARRDSNPQPAVLETAALPIELLAYLKRETGSGPQDPKARCHASESRHPDPAGYYLMTLATTPAPTVRPPSRIAKRRPSSIAIGWIRLTVIFTLSPGITISTPSTVVFWVGRMPTTSISSPTLITPRSIRPVTTVPRPEIENTSSTGIRNGLSIARTGSGM